MDRSILFVKNYLNGIKKTKRKKVIFIDEFPWMDTQRSGFLPVFENFWNDYCTTRNDLIVIICGSAASYMVRKIIQNKKGLSKRITKTIKLNPFSLSETKEFFKYKKNPIEKMELLKIYMAFGGIAEYLENIKKGESSVMAINRMCFEENAYLENEFEEVFKSLFEENSYHHKIMLVLAKKPKKGISRDQILKELNISSGGRFSDSLNDLLYSGFVLSYVTHNGNKKVKLYRIYDEFCLFYLQFMTKFKGSSWINIYPKQEYISWCGNAFESICLKNVSLIKKALKCNQILSNDYVWHNENAQIDLVIDRNDNIVNLFEIKFHNVEFSIDQNYLQKLRKKEQEFKETSKTKKSINTAMLTTWGVKENKYSQAILSYNITMDCLFDKE
ncbi:MAG: ATP-binding protein [Flavobacteriia bacterium]|nr:ATP-binding protein [Flavobacteriia bacterium]